ncbi:MAG TPA: 4'-phosphopantetheinyl transferase superfamily protein [Candidatus Faecousia intestinigallinarum]|nr:4'-phosphopantetheinyl transferase superfamily protein [Candidatus Faecousia intestinigallinarum]
MPTSSLWLWGQVIPPGSTGHEAGRALLEKMYRAYTGEALPEIAAAPGGKPYFPDAPLHFSISHTPRHVFCALSPRRVGVDAEELTRNVKLALAEKILSPGEYAQYVRAEDQRRALLTFWVLKEAQAKCTGRGLTGYPNQTSFSLEDPRVTTQSGCLVAVMEEETDAV